nr:hypothetical protein [Tanacetum cinerariifolium]
MIMKDFNSRTKSEPRTENMITEKWTRMQGDCQSDMVKKIQYVHVRNILKKFPKWNATEPIDADNLQELFGPDPREHPASKQRAPKKQRSVDTSSAGGSQSESVWSLVSQDYRRKCDAAERARTRRREKKN